MKLTVKEDGFRGLAKGWAPTFIGYSFQGLGKFGFYEIFKVLYSNMLGEVCACVCVCVRMHMCVHVCGHARVCSYMCQHIPCTHRCTVHVFQTFFYFFSGLTQPGKDLFVEDLSLLGSICQCRVLC